MPKTRLALLAACLLITGLLAGGRSAAAQESTCNEGHARGVAESTLASCISQARQNDLDISFETACTCPAGGYTVTVIGTAHCPGQQICPLFAVLVGTVQLDCDFNVVASTCGVPQG